MDDFTQSLASSSQTLDMLNDPIKFENICAPRSLDDCKVTALLQLKETSPQTFGVRFACCIHSLVQPSESCAEELLRFE